MFQRHINSAASGETGVGTAADSAVSTFNCGCRAAVPQRVQRVSVDIGGGEKISAEEKGRLKKILKHTGRHGAARGV